jgi:hypothetical protein
VGLLILARTRTHTHKKKKSVGEKNGSSTALEKLFVFSSIWILLKPCREKKGDKRNLRLLL